MKSRNQLIVAIIVLIVLGTSFVLAVFQYNLFPSQSTGTVGCVPSPNGHALDIKVVSDASGQPISNLQFQATSVLVCNNVRTTIGLAMPQTNSTGLVSLPAAYLSLYSVEIRYQRKTIDFDAEFRSDKVTSVVVSLPSGAVNVSYE